MSKINIKKISICGILLALGVLASIIKIISLPFGGSVTACSTMFIALIGYLFGLKAGLFSAFTYGLIKFILNPYIISPFQVFLDYFCASTALGLTCIFSKRKHGLILGYIFAMLIRFLFFTLSGILFFSEYTWSGWNVIMYSLTYNAISLVPEMIISCVILTSIPFYKILKK